MPAAYPASLPLALLDKTREQPAAFTVAQPRRGWGYVEPTGTDTPVFWPVTWRFTTEQAQTFRQWFVYDLERGTLAFTMQIRTEFGLTEHECQLLPEGLLPARQIGGDLWEYRATIMARESAVPRYDPLFASVALLLNGGGTHGATTFADLSGYARAQTAQAGFAGSNEQALSGLATSIKGVGGAWPSASYVRWTPGGEWTGRDWCFEAYIRRFTTADYAKLWFCDAPANFDIDLNGENDTGTYAVRMLTSGIVRISSSTVMALNTWYHVAVSGEYLTGTTVRARLFINGTQEATTDRTDLDLPSMGSTFGLGRLSGFSGAPFYVWAARMTLATRYTSNFTPDFLSFPT